MRDMRLRGMERSMQQKERNRQQMREMDAIVEDCKEGNFSRLHTLELYHAVNEVLRRNSAKPEDLQRWIAEAKAQARLEGKHLHEIFEGDGSCVFCWMERRQWVSCTAECSSHKAALELFEPGTSLEDMINICVRWTKRARFHQDRLIRQVRAAEHDGVEVWVGARPLAELHISTGYNCGHCLTPDEARVIVRIIRTELGI